MHSKMKKIIPGLFVLLFLICSCGNKKSKMDPFGTLTDLVDSVKVQNEDSLLFVEEKEEETVPMKADESFNDFIYNFSTDKELQLSRVVFPLPFYNKDVPSKIEKQYWKHDDLYSKRQLYTLIFDKETDMDLVQDTSLNSVRFEWYYMHTHMMKKYYFERKKGAWMLEAVNLHPTEGDENEEFVNFFYRFANDSVFQVERIAEPLEFVTVDPDDDFAILETTLDLNQWLAFMPPLPKKRLTNINYGQRLSKTSPFKILALKGIGNGFSNMLYFRKYGQEWKLYKFEDLGD